MWSNNLSLRITTKKLCLKNLKRKRNSRQKAAMTVKSSKSKIRSQRRKADGKINSSIFGSYQSSSHKKSLQTRPLDPTTLKQL